MTTPRAQRSHGGYRLSGTKTWITHAPIADLMIVWAKDDDGRVGGFILERGMNGPGHHQDRGQVLGARLADRADP